MRNRLMKRLVEQAVTGGLAVGGSSQGGFEGGRRESCMY